MAYLRRVQWPRKVGFVLLDAVLIAVAMYCALALRFETSWNDTFFNMYSHLLEILAIYLLTLTLGGMYDILWRYAGVTEAFRVSVLCGIGTVASIGLAMLFHWNVSRVVLCLIGLITLMLVLGTRVV